MNLPEGVRRKAEALGSIGRQWVQSVPATLLELEALWECSIGDALDGGTSAYVAHARTASGDDATVKLAIPDGLEGNSAFQAELDALRLGDPRAYVRVCRADVARRAMLLQRLGDSLYALQLPVDVQARAIAETLRASWVPAPADTGIRTGADQAAWLIGFIESRWAGTDRPCERATIDRALSIAATRRDAFEPDGAVLIHGDAHPRNVLVDPSGESPSGFKLIDPDAMVSSPAHDLAICLRDWTAEMLAGDAVELGTTWCSLLAEIGGADPRAIWQWAFVERVSTGLFLIELGDPYGREMLHVADIVSVVET